MEARLLAAEVDFLYVHGWMARIHNGTAYFSKAGRINFIQDVAVAVQKKINRGETT